MSEQMHSAAFVLLICLLMAAAFIVLASGH